MEAQRVGKANYASACLLARRLLERDVRFVQLFHRGWDQHIALARQLPEADASTQAGKWEKNRFMGVEVTGKTLGLIGAGNIGSIVADRALGLKMKVIAFDPFLSPERAIDLGVEKVELDELFRRADLEPDELGNIPPLTPCDTITLPGNGNGYEALSMTDGHIVAVQNFSIFANSQVLVYRIADDSMTQTGSYYPWETSIDSGSVFAGN